MIIKEANFVGSFVRVQDCPAPILPEYAFIGRSNVGKSSLINMLTGRKKLVKVSSTPGKTQTINHFIINNEFYFVDLPGYGYARVSKTSRKQWERFIRDYLVKRDNLQCVCVLIDSRIPPQKIDIEFINWLGEMHIAFIIIFTKADKNKPIELSRNVENFKKAVLETWEEFPQYFITSSVKKTGKKEFLSFINEINVGFDPEIG